MATRNHDGQKRKFPRPSQAMPPALLKPGPHSAEEANMKGVGACLLRQGSLSCILNDCLAVW